MRKTLALLALGSSLVFSTAFSTAAQAESFLIKNSEFNYEFSVPDRWHEVGGMASRTDYTYIARGDNLAGCSINADKDTRFLAYQAEEFETVTEQEFTKSFFETQVPKMNIGQNDALNVNVHNIQRGSLGNGYSRFALVDYTDLSGAEIRSILIASIYRDMQMVVSCQAKRDVFQSYFPTLMSVVGSITFENEFRPYPSLYYRDFIGNDQRTWIDILWKDLMSSIGL